MDSLADFGELTEGLVKDLERLGPFGHGNPQPLLGCRDARIAAPPRRVGKSGDHLQLVLRQGQTTCRCIGFGYGAREPSLASGVVNLAVQPPNQRIPGQHAGGIAHQGSPAASINDLAPSRDARRPAFSQKAQRAGRFLPRWPRGPVLDDPGCPGTFSPEDTRREAKRSTGHRIRWRAISVPLEAGAMDDPAEGAPLEGAADGELE